MGPTRRRAWAKIVVVDDERLIREVLGAVLSAAGYEVRLVRSGFEALGQLERGGVELVFLGARLPGLGGWRALGRIRQRHPALKVVLMSENADRGRALAAGAVAVLEKPYSPARVLAALDEAMASEAPGARRAG